MEFEPAPLSPGSERFRPLVERKKKGHLDGRRCGYQEGKLRSRLGRKRPVERVCVNCTRCGYRTRVGHAELATSLVETATSGLRRIVEWGYASISRENFALIARRRKSSSEPPKTSEVPGLSNSRLVPTVRAELATAGFRSRRTDVSTLILPNTKSQQGADAER